MRSWTLCCLLLLFAPIAGCVDDPLSSATEHQEEDDQVLETEEDGKGNLHSDDFKDASEPSSNGTESFGEQPYSFGGCTYLEADVWIDIERAKSFLPPGYEPKDGGNLVGLNPGLGLTGIANLALLAFDCSHVNVADGTSSWVQVIIDLEPPNVDNRTPTSSHNMYEVVLYVDDDEHEGFLSQANLPSEQVNVSVDLLDPADGGLMVGSATVSDEQGEILSFRVVGGGNEAVNPEGAFWHQHEDGVTFTELSGTASLSVGTTVECRLAPGSLLAELADATDCSSTARVGLLADRFDVSGQIEVIEGARAEA